MKTYFDADASLDPLRDQTLAIIGYGNQGRAQALNLRDSGLRVIVGNLQDESAKQAERDGFAVLSIAEAAEKGDVLALLIPDEVQRQVYDEVIAKRLRPGQTLAFATGYNIHFGVIVPPKDIDCIMVAPRMMGAMVRSSFERGEGTRRFPGRRSGRFRQSPAEGAGVGARHRREHARGVIETTFAEETELDLFQEQAFWPMFLRAMVETYEFLVEKEYPPEIVALENLRHRRSRGDLRRDGPRRPCSNRCGSTRQPAVSARFPVRTTFLSETRCALLWIRPWNKSVTGASPSIGKRSSKRDIPSSRSSWPMRRRTPINQVEERMHKLLKFKME